MSLRFAALPYYCKIQVIAFGMEGITNEGKKERC
jgi:hypothetical protein